MKIFLHFALIAVLVAAVSVHAAADEQAVPEKKSAYTVTVIPFYSPEKLWSRYSPLIEYLKKTTGKPWELKLYHNHDTLIEGLCSGEVSFALLGPVPLGRVIEKCGAGIAVVAVDDKGKPFYHSILLTSEPSITSINKLRGKPFGLFKGSTASHILPLTMLKKSGLGMPDIVPVFYSSQDQIINALLKHEIAAAGVKEALYRKFRKKPLAVLKTSKPLPNFAFATSPSADAETVSLFSDALLKLRPKKQDKTLMKDWDDEIKNGFIRTPRDFQPSVMNLVEAYREIMRENK